MSRYIDADAIRYHDMSDGQGMWYVWRDEIHDMPTADVVEVVRCKDCRYWQEYQEGHYPNELCPWDKNETTDEDDYCSFGERKEEDE